MKVKLLVNLKIGSGKIYEVGSIFTDKDEPIPEFIMKRVQRGQAVEIKEPIQSVPSEVVFPKEELATKKKKINKLKK